MKTKKSDWSVRTPHGQTDQLTEDKAWDTLLKLSQGELLRGGVVVAQRLGKDI